MASNPFDSDNEDEFRGGVTARRDVNLNKTNTYTRKEPEPQDDDFNFYERQIEASMQSSLASTQRSMRALEESEDVGINTAQDLLRQGEVLRKVDKNLDEIKATTNQTQTHLNNIKSVFGGVKNYFTRKKGPDTTTDLPPPPATTNLKSTITGTNVSGPGSVPKSASYSSGPSLPDRSRDAIRGTKWENMDTEIDAGLDAMSENLRRLQGLGKAMGEEIETQNVLLDRLGTKAGDTDLVVRGQDKQMRKILGTDKKTSPKKTTPSTQYP